MSSGIRIDTSSLMNNLKKLENKTFQATKLYADSAGVKMVNYAKSNAPWEDRTTNSRQTINHETKIAGNNVIIAIKGNTPHFKYLELAMEKRWAILWPTLQRFQGEIVSGWRNVLGK